MNLVVVVLIVSVPLCLCCIVVRYNVIPGCVDPTRSGQERESHRLFIDDDAMMIIIIIKGRRRRRR